MINNNKIAFLGQQSNRSMSMRTPLTPSTEWVEHKSFADLKPKSSLVPPSDRSLAADAGNMCHFIKGRDYFPGPISIYQYMVDTPYSNFLVSYKTGVYL